MVDCSHANSGKRHERQQVVWSSVIEQRASGNRALIGAMLESNLVEGRQELATDPSALRYGVSITDACIGWDGDRAAAARGRGAPGRIHAMSETITRRAA